MRKLALTLAAIMSAACSPGSFSGTIVGTPLSVQDVIFAVLKTEQGKSAGMFVLMSDKPNMCASLKANREPKNATAVMFQLLRISANAEILAPEIGDYTVKPLVAGSGAGNYAYSVFAKTDANCTEALSATNVVGQSGIVKVTALKAEANGTAAGTFDITYGTQNDKVTGAFNASYCDITQIAQSPNCE
jgi:hypothetical protein